MEKSSFNFYKVLSILTSVLFVYLFFLLLLNSESLIIDVGLEPSVSSAFLAKRTSTFMLGISVLMFSSRNLLPSKARQNICLATGTTMLGLSIMGTYELVNGNINSSILPAILIELAVAISFGIIFYRNRKVLPQTL